jgi:uncharacterized protein YcaQ
MNLSLQSLPELSPAQARMLHLAAQGLLHPPRRKALRSDVTAAIERMRMLQIDSIHVVARSPYLVLFSRLGCYPKAWLDEALETGHIAECWAHEACFVPAADYPWHMAAGQLRDRHWAHKRARRMQREHGKALQALLRQLKQRGPLRAQDLATQGPRRSGWWQWTAEKSALEALFALGKVMVARRDRFQRVYDLTERVLERMLAVGNLPDRIDPDPDRLRMHFAADAIRALGIALPSWVGDYHRLGAAPSALLQALVECGEVCSIHVRGWDQPALVHRDHAGLVRRIAEGRLRATHATLLSPFDPVVWDRTRVRELFGFDYTLECYTPAHKRRYGYFVLPFLCRGKLSGRVDAKAHREDGVFEVRALHVECERSFSDAQVHALVRSLEKMARWHATSRVVLGGNVPSRLRRRLQVVMDCVVA